jgi:hypothetical protein
MRLYVASLYYTHVDYSFATFFNKENGVTDTADRHTNQPIRMGGSFQ